MGEYEGYTEEEFETDIEIDFSKFSLQELDNLIEAIVRRKTYTFKDIPVTFSGDVTIDIDPIHNEGYD